MNLLSEKIRAVGACDFLRPSWLEAKQRAERAAWADPDLNFAFETINSDMNELLENLGYFCLMLETGAEPIKKAA